MLTWRRREKGRHSWKVVFVRKSLKNCGQDGSVKLLPRLASKGRGNDVEIGVAVSIVDWEMEEVEDGAGMFDGPPAEAADELLESSSCRA